MVVEQTSADRDGSTRLPDVSAVIVAFGDEPWLEGCVHSCLEQRGVAVEVVLVDNGCTDGAVDRLEGAPGVRVIRPGRNLGFAAGCNLGAANSTAPVLAMVNPDTQPAPGSLAELARVATLPEVGVATCSLRLASDPELLNSAGNEVHFLGLSWSGAFEEPAADHDRQRDVLAASGAGMAIRRELWVQMGGFVEALFAYQEDAELSLRCWQRGLRVVYVPESVIVHRYEFSRNPQKFFLLDRNRLMVVLTLYQRRTLVMLAPLLLLQELAMFPVAVAQGWLPQRLRSVGWILRHVRMIRDRRAWVARQRVVGDDALAPMMATVVQPGNLPLPSWAVTVQSPFVWWWAVVRRLL